MQSLINRLWDDYLEITNDAERIHNLFGEHGEKVINDHIALRTFNQGSIRLEMIAQLLDSHGYEAKEDYFFTEKKLRAQHFEHSKDQDAPKIFVSELILEEMPTEVVSIIEPLVIQANEYLKSKDLTLPVTPWGMISSDEYNALAQYSEYAAWTAAFGLRANHFTVSVNHLKSLKTIENVNDFVKQHGFELNKSGGEIKGSKEVKLIQSSTMANIINWQFSDVRLPIRSCFYEFAQRFTDENTGKLYQGFVTSSADKIFESTNNAAVA